MLLYMEERKVKHAKYTAIGSLIFTIIPYISALLTNAISLPLTQIESYEVILICMFMIGWSILFFIVSNLSEDMLQKLKLMEDASKRLKGYWLIEYEGNVIMPCSVLEFRDDCGRATASKLCDYKNDLSILRELGIHNLQFNGDDQLIQIFAKGNSNYSFIRLEFRHEDMFDIIRIDDNGTDKLVKVKGSCYRIKPYLLLQAGICEGERTAKSMLKKFNLNSQNIENLLLHIYRNRNTEFSQRILYDRNTRIFFEGSRVEERNAEFVSADKKIKSKKRVGKGRGGISNG